MSIDKAFKVCPMCGEAWQTRDDLIQDTSLLINGYDVDFENLNDSLFYFTHMIEGCKSTFAIPANEFLDLYTGTHYTERRTGEIDCPGYCLQKDQLERCKAMCECAFNREIIHIIMSSRKN